MLPHEHLSVVINVKRALSRSAECLQLLSHISLPEENQHVIVYKAALEKWALEATIASHLAKQETLDSCEDKHIS